ncbi:hypothetical protein SAMN04487980_103245 [Streptomyces sp. cf124]|nr:hypothetical protein SAMN04487980_103245 [Streptomyces sp. cf124]
MHAHGSHGRPELGRHTKGRRKPSGPATRRGRGAVATVTAGVQAEAAAFAASRTAPATAPATLSLKTLGMM